MTNTKKPAASKKAEEQFAEADAKAQPTPKEQRAEINKAFEEADDDGKSAIIAETQAGLGVRGY